MQFLKIAGGNVKLAENQPEYETILVRKGTTYIKHGSLYVPQTHLVAELKPDEAEIAHLNEGGTLYLEILGTSWPPVAIGISDPALRNPEGNA